jgi:hypothetical protein
MRGGDLSCEGSSSEKLVGDAAVRARAGRLASEGLDEDLHTFPETQLQVKGGLLLDVVVSKGTTPQAARQLTEVFTLWMMVLLSSSGIILPSKGAPNPGPRHLCLFSN